MKEVQPDALARAGLGAAGCDAVQYLSHPGGYT